MADSGKMKTTRHIRKTLYAVLALAVFMALNLLAGSTVMASSGKSTLPDKAGFTESTTVTVKDFSMSVPTYWESDINTGDEFRAYCMDDTFAMLLIETFDGASELSFKDEMQRNLFVQSMLSAIGNDGSLIESSYKTIGSLEGAYAVFDITVEGMPFTGTMFATIDGDNAYCYMLCENPDNKYDYLPDFLKTLGTSKKNDAAAGAANAPADDKAAFSDETQKAISDGEKYLGIKAYSKAGLIEQLSSEYGSGYSKEAATEAVEYLEKTLPIDWNEQAVSAANTYMEVMELSKDMLMEVLTSDYGSKFTKEQAEYAINKLGL